MAEKITESSGLQKWHELAEKELKCSPDTLLWHTAEGITIKPLYTVEDLTGNDTLSSLPGFDVLAGPLFQTLQEAVHMAIEAKVQMIGVSSLAAGHKTLLPQLTSELKARNSTIITICGSVVPWQDYDFLRTHGVAAIFGPGTIVIEAAVLDIMQGQLRNG